MRIETLLSIHEDLKYAEQHNDDSLKKCLERVQEIADNNYSILNISKDFEKHSYVFSIEKNNGNIYLNGGIIFHGFKDEKDPAQFSVTLSRVYGWSIHT